MSLHQRDSYAAFVTGLPGVTLHEQWEALVAKVGGMVFCLLADTGGDLVFKVGEIGFDGLTELDGIEQAIVGSSDLSKLIFPLRQQALLIADLATRGDGLDETG